MKYFTISDPHGNLRAMQDALDAAGYTPKNKNHQIICCGDMFGRAAQNVYDCVYIWKYLTSTMHVNKPICLRGNHESILLDILNRGELTDVDCYNGEHKTLASFLAVPSGQVKYDYDRQWEAIKVMRNCGFEKWLQELPWYFETEHYIFVHGFLPRHGSQFAITNFAAIDDEAWDAASWCDTPADIRIFAHDYPYGINKTIVFGHWHSSKLVEEFHHQFPPYGVLFEHSELKLIGLDATTAATYKVLCKVIED